MDQTYSTGAASLFSSIARASVIYVIHRDHPNDRWNVFKKTGLYEEFVQHFYALKDAQDFCDQMNNS